MPQPSRVMGMVVGSVGGYYSWANRFDMFDIETNNRLTSLSQTIRGWKSSNMFGDDFIRKNEKFQLTKSLSLDDDDDDDDQMELINVHIIHRHGDRTPINSLHKDGASKEAHMWVNLISKIYNPFSEEYMSQDQSHRKLTTKDDLSGDEMFQWKSINKRLRNGYLIHTEDNYITGGFGGSQTLFDWAKAQPSFMIWKDGRIINNDNDNKDDQKDYYSYGQRYAARWLGELTDDGVKQMESLGRFLKTRYIDKYGYLSPNTPDLTKIRVTTSNMNRTIFSLDSLLQGLYPNHTSLMPIFIDHEFTLMYTRSKSCPSLLSRRTQSLIKNHDRCIDPIKQDKINNVFRRLIKHFELDMSKYAAKYGGIDFVYMLLGESLGCYLAHCDESKEIDDYLPNNNIDNENYVSKQDIREFINYCAHRLQMMNLDRGVRRLYQGVLLQRMMNSFERDPKGTFRVMSGHDNTLLAMLPSIQQGSIEDLMMSYQNDDNNDEFPNLLFDWPKYASSVIFEVWRRKSDGERFVRLLHDTELCDIRGGYKMKGIGLEGEPMVDVMPLSELKERWSDLIINRHDHQMECLC